MKTKLIEWSYPSSPNAVQFGFKSGCYTLQTMDTNLVPFDGHKIVSAHATIKEARLAGESLPFPWHVSMASGWRAGA
ncbi:MAG: hypothetical protein V4563_14260 [Pseudomonadota bacterium]